MKRRPILQDAHDALRNPNKKAVTKLLDSVSLTLQEREVIEKNCLQGLTLEEICNDFVNWGQDKKSICSPSQIYRIKRSGMRKIGSIVAKK